MTPRVYPDRRTSAAIRDAARRPTRRMPGLSTRSAAASTPSASSAPSVTSAACKASAHHPSRRRRPSRTSSLSSPKGAQANWRLAACSPTDATFGSTYSNWEATAKHTSARANSSELKGVFMGDTSKKKGRGTGQIGREGGESVRCPPQRGIIQNWRAFFSVLERFMKGAQILPFRIDSRTDPRPS